MKKIACVIIFILGLSLFFSNISLAEEKKSISHSQLNNKVDELIKILKYEKETTVYKPNKIDAVIALGLLKNPRCVDVLIEYLENTYSDALRAQIIKSLGWIGDKKALPSIINTLKSDPYEHCRAYAALALGDMGGGQRVIAALEEAYNNDEDMFVRNYAAQSLERITGKSYPNQTDEIMQEIEKNIEKLLDKTKKTTNQD